MKNIINKLILLYQNNKTLVLTITKYLFIVVATLLLTKWLCNSPIPGPVIENNIEEVKTLRDRNNKLVAVIEEKNLDIARNTQLLDSLAYALRIKPKYIKGVDREVTKLDTVWEKDVVYIPGVNLKDSTVIKYKDEYVNILAVGKEPSSRSYIKFGLTSDTTYRVKIYKNPLFGRPISQTYVVHSNPYFQTTHGDSYQEKERRAILTFSLSLGYDPFQKKFFGGPTIGVPIKTFYTNK